MNTKVLPFVSDNVYAAQIVQGLKGCKVEQLQKLPTQLDPVAREIALLLKKQYPELARGTHSNQEFLGKVFDSFMTAKPKNQPKSEYLGTIIERLKQNPEIEQKINLLANKKNIDFEALG